MFKGLLVFVFFLPDLMAFSTEKVSCTFSRYISEAESESAEVMSKPFEINFQPWTSKLAAGYTKNFIWMRADCENNSNDPIQNFFEIDYSFLQIVDIYSSNPDFPDYSLGKRLKIESKFSSIENRYVVALYNFSRHEKRNIYFRIASSGPVIGDIKIYSYKEYLEKEAGSSLGLGIYFGLFIANVFLVMFLIFSAIASRHATDLALFFFYLFYVITNTLYQFSYAGLSPLYLWPSESPFSVRSVLILSPILILFLNEYGRRFINLETIAPRINIALVLLSIFTVILIPFCLYGEFSTVSKLISQIALSTFVFYFVLSLILVLKKTQNSALYFLGWSSYLVGTSVLILRNFNVLPFNFFTKHSQEIGTLVEMTFFSISLVNRVRAGSRELVKGSAVMQTTAAISHEIKRPFRVVLAEIKGLTVKHPQLARELTDSTLPIVNSAFDRLNKLIDEYRMIGGRHQNHFSENVNILGVANEASESIKSLFPNFRGEMAIRGIPAIVYGSKSHFQKLFENLFENAIESAGVETKISVDVSRRFFGDIFIEISNTGSVIPISISKDLFKIYVTTKPGGHGLGLALCKKLASDLGGTISGESEENSTTFTVKLPRSSLHRG